MMRVRRLMTPTLVHHLVKRRRRVMRGESLRTLGEEEAVMILGVVEERRRVLAGRAEEVEGGWIRLAICLRIEERLGGRCAPLLLCFA